MTTKPTGPAITYETVAQACEALTAEGKRPSVRNIIAQLGRGSPNMVLDYQRQWKAGRPTVKSDEINVDPRIGQIVAEQISQAVAHARADIEIQLAEAEQDAETVGKAGREAEEHARILEDELESARAQIQGQAGQIEQLKADAEQVKAEAQAKVSAAEERGAREQTDREAAQVALAKAELRLEALPHLENEIKKQDLEIAEMREQLLQAHGSAAQAEQDAAVLRAKLEAAQARIDDLAGREQTALTKANDAEKQIRDLGRELATANLSVQAGQARLESAARELSDAKKAAETARQAAKQAGEHAAELKGQLTARHQAEKSAKPTAKSKSGAGES